MDAPSPPPLRCLGGGATPADLADDLRCVRRLPPEAARSLWQVLGPSLADKLPPEVERLLDVFCAAYRLGDDDLARVLKACRFVLREAARVDLPAAAFGEDLDRICPDEPLVKELLLAGYASAKEQIRRDVLRGALADHGNLLVGVKWRLDDLQATEHATNLRARVALLTLSYRDGAETRRLTLQVLPDMMGELKGICEQVLA
ncbi:MAG TPA: hypothetical protein VGM56_25420 [Byssovorax sp.]